MSDPPTGRELTVRPLDGATGSWDNFVTSAEGASFAHLAGWRDVLSQALGAECLYWVATNPQGEWHGVLPLARVKSRLFGHYLVSLPFLNYGGPLGSPGARRRLVADAVAEARRGHADLLELRTRHDADLGLPVSPRKITVLRELPESPDELWNAFPSKLRSQIRKPIKDGLEARFGPDQREAFYEVFARTMRDLGTPVLPRAWFERIAVTFPELVVFGVVYGRDEPLAAGCGFVWGGEFEMTWAAARRDHGHGAANMLLYWSFMQEMIRRRMRVFNFGRCTPGGGTHRFKQQWGGRDVPLPWAQWTSRNVTAPPTPDRPVFRAAAACWRRLPLVLTNAIGPIIARRLP